jgi:hypothetical protein
MVIQLESIASAGDCIFAVSEAGGQERLFLVCAAKVREKSDVMKALMSGAWAERQPSSHYPPTYTLPDDNAEALRNFFLVVHEVNQHAPETLSMTQLENLAATARKYMFVGSLQMASRRWVSHLAHRLPTASPDMY